MDFCHQMASKQHKEKINFLIETSPPGYSYLNQPRLTGRGGGLAVVYKNCFKCHSITFGSFTTFESLCFTVSRSARTLCILIYRPPKSTTGFITEFSEFLSIAIPKFDNILILGDFNVHICCPENVLAGKFLNLAESFNLSLAPTGPTHT